jgi:hypothetical protein
MKQFRTTLIVTLVAAVTVPSFAAESQKRDSDQSVRTRILKYCDPVCELQSQDKAFAMLIEAYRQFQSHQIQTDFEQRLRAAAAIGEERGSMIIQADLNGVRTFRTFVEELAKKECELRMQQLQTQVTNFNTAYGCMRRVDEEDVGEAVTKQVDTKTAAAKLTTFSIVALGSPATANYRLVKAAPANSIFLDAPPVPAPMGRVIEPCD